MIREYDGRTIALKKRFMRRSIKSFLRKRGYTHLSYYTEKELYILFCEDLGLYPTKDVFWFVLNLYEDPTFLEIGAKNPKRNLTI
jgi:hypothetical protein